MKNIGPVKQLTDTIKAYPKSIPIEQILKLENNDGCFMFETRDSYVLIRTS